MSKYTLTHRKCSSQELCIEYIGKDKQLYFQQEYNDALKLVKEIVDLQRIENNSVDDKNEERKGDKNKKTVKHGCNNRILFIGQRRCGKTSLTHSLANYLAEPKVEVEYKDWEKVEFKTEFCFLPMVDASQFDNNNNILLTVISSMFSLAKNKMKINKDGGDATTCEDLLKQFEKVFKSLDFVKSELSSYTLESLNRKSHAENLKDNMKDLVRKYLTFEGYGDESRLVLLIDDIDKARSYAHEMLEQLRKYLELDNLIILMSANLEQLTNEIQEYFGSAFKNRPKDSNLALFIDVEDLTTKYLLKLFPTSRRIIVERHVTDC